MAVESPCAYDDATGIFLKLRGHNSSPHESETIFNNSGYDVWFHELSITE